MKNDWFQGTSFNLIFTGWPKKTKWLNVGVSPREKQQKKVHTPPTKELHFPDLRSCTCLWRDSRMVSVAPLLPVASQLVTASHNDTKY